MTDKQDKQDAKDERMAAQKQLAEERKEEKREEAAEQRREDKQAAKDENDLAAADAAQAEEAIKHPDPKRHPKAGDSVKVALGPGVHQKHTLKVTKAREDITSPDGQISVEVKLDYEHLTIMHKSHNGQFPYWEWPE